MDNRKQSLVLVNTEHGYAIVNKNDKTALLVCCDELADALVERMLQSGNRIYKNINEAPAQARTENVLYMNKQEITNLIYNASEYEAKHYLQSCTDKEDLYIYAFNYNFDGGFDIPDIILNNPVCTISTAKLIFGRADGANYLRSKVFDNELPEWSTFIYKLYSRIIAHDFHQDNFKFIVPLSKIQKFKLKKEIAHHDQFLVEDYAGIDLDIEV